MKSEAALILDSLEKSCVLKSPIFAFQDYWHTQLSMIAVIVGAFFLRNSLTVSDLAIYGSIVMTNVVWIAVRDTKRSLNRRYEALVEHLEAKGLL